MNEPNNVLLNTEDGVALVTVNRPQALNSLNGSVLGNLLRAFTALGEDPAVKVIVLTGKGEKSFVAGAHIPEMADLTVQQALEFARKGQHLIGSIGRLAKPVIAAVNGFALGGGLELALACDLIYASENARLGLPEVTLGIMPGFGGTQNLGRTIGRIRANELIFTGKMLSAAQARQWGLVNAVFPAGELIDRALKTARTIAANGSVAVAHAKEAVKVGLDMSEAGGLSHEAALFAALFATADQKEGIRAFQDKRKPVFTGR